MDVTRIRIIRPDRSVAVVDQTHSQLCATLQGIPREEFRAFLAGTAVTTPAGANVKLVDMENVR